MEKENFLLTLLDEKEERAKRQKELIEKYHKTLISFGLNIPGEIKISKEINDFFEKSLKKIKEELNQNDFSTIYEEIKNKVVNIAFLILDTENKKNSEEIKKLLVNLEENLEYGRILDIDVFDENYNLISRTDLGFKKRKCFLCERDALYCIKNKTHKYEDLVDKTMFYIKN